MHLPFFQIDSICSERSIFLFGKAGQEASEIPPM